MFERWEDGLSGMSRKMEGVERGVSKLGTSQIAGPWGPAEEVGIHSESSKHVIQSMLYHITGCYVDQGFPSSVSLPLIHSLGSIYWAFPTCWALSQVLMGLGRWIWPIPSFQESHTLMAEAAEQAEDHPLARCAVTDGKRKLREPGLPLTHPFRWLPKTFQNPPHHPGPRRQGRHFKNANRLSGLMLEAAWSLSLIFPVRSLRAFFISLYLPSLYKGIFVLFYH